MTPHSSILAWRIPRTEEPGRLQSMGLWKSQTRLSDFHFIHLFKNQQSGPNLKAFALTVPSELLFSQVSICKAPSSTYFIWACVLSKPFLDDSIQKSISGTFLVVQWLRIHLSMQGTWVWSRKILHAAKQLNLHATTAEPMCRTCGSSQTLEPVLGNQRSHRNEKPLLAVTGESRRGAVKTPHSQKTMN